MKKCANCSRSIGDSAGTCAYCGRNVPVPAQAPAIPRPRARAARRRPVVRRSGGGSGAAKMTIGGAIVIAVGLALFGLRVAGAANRVMGRSVVDETVSIAPDDAHEGGIEVQGSVSYTFTVTAYEGEVMMLFGQVGNFNNFTEQDFLRLMAGARKVPAGATEVMSGRISSGHYAWGVINSSETRSARVYVKFHGR